MSELGGSQNNPYYRRPKQEAEDHDKRPYDHLLCWAVVFRLVIDLHGGPHFVSPPPRLAGVSGSLSLLFQVGAGGLGLFVRVWYYKSQKLRVVSLYRFVELFLVVKGEVAVARSPEYRYLGSTHGVGHGL